MASTSYLAKSKLSFAIAYGFVEGPAHAKIIIKLLERAGYLLKPLDEADIIIAHSAGGWLIPKTAKPKIVMYIGMPLASTSLKRAWVQTNLRRLREGILSSFQVFMIHAFYGLSQPGRNIGILRMAKFAEVTLFTSATPVFIANKDDPWLKSANLPQIISDNKWAYISLPGSHNDIWEHSERYLAIIKYYARLLAQADS